MVSWLIIGVLAVMILLFFKAKHMQHRFFAIFLILLLVFVYTTGSKIVKDNDIDVGSFNGMVTAGKLYVGWLSHAFDNTKAIAGNAIKMNWGSNSSITTSP